QIGFALILGGAVGNLLDRVRFGYVVDFLDFFVSGHHWPAFNVADSAICVGVGMLSWTCSAATRSPGPRLPPSNVLPRLLHIGSFSLPTYGVLVATAYLVAIWLLNRKAQAEGLPKEKILDLSLYVLTAAILGAKLLLIIVEWRRYWANPRELIEVVQSAGVFYGGLLCASVVGIWYLRKHRLPAWRIADMGAPSIALGEAIGRWGCFAAGCCYGKETSGPFHVTFTNPLAHENVGTPLNVPLHPTQIYLSLNSLLIFLVLQWVYRRKSFDGEVFWLYVLLYSVTRGIIEIFRGDTVRGFLIPDVLSTSQFIGILTALASAGMLFYLSRRNRAEA
ncbi:MAG TPA: prolipoprotein diacylglyceryl transferase, partial [Thermoanaerobaculia bacterium]